jgi:uncharacterized cupredoxin-like copper-binding protein
VTVPIQQQKHIKASLIKNIEMFIMKKKPILLMVFLVSMFSAVVLLGTIQAQTENQVTVYAGDTPTYGFGNSASSISSPGPALTFTAGETVKVTLQNSGTMLHNFAIVGTKSSTGTVLWSSQIASASNPVTAGSSASVTFTVGAAGSYFYICQVDGHVALGMWGTVTVTPAVPEYPAALLVVLIAVMATALTAYIQRVNLKHKTRL